jgi:hypothetical protein
MPFINTKDVGPVVLEIPPADEGSITGTVMDCWHTFGGCRAGGRGRRQGRQIPHFASQLRGRGAGRLYPNAVGYLPGLRIVAFHFEGRQRGGRQQVRCLCW